MYEYISGVDEKKITGVVSSAVQRFRIKGTSSLLFLHTCLAVISIRHKRKYCRDLNR
jgi:hypothetical protein